MAKDSDLKSVHKNPQTRRTWRLSVAGSLTLVGITVILGATVNPFIGRTVHWDWMAAVAAVLLVGITVALRRRWV